MIQPQLSLCLIVRDEQAMLPDFLASVDGLWDELVAVDTGSADNTVALLEAAGAQVTPYNWHDDFAAARNASLATATGRWILFLDADERMTPALGKQIRALLADEQAGAATVVMRNALPDGGHHDANLVRLFRRDPTIHFRHRIHEDILDDVTSFLARNHLGLRHLTGVVEHLGYVREAAAAKDKQRRDQALLRRALADDPSDFYCWFKLLESARFWHDRALGQQVAAEVAPLLGEGLSANQRRKLTNSRWSGELAALVSEGLFTAPAPALQWLEQWRAHFHHGTAWHLHRASLLENLGRHDDSLAAFAAGLAALEPATEHLRVRILMGQCRHAAANGDLEQAQAHCAQAVAAAPTDPEALLAAVSFANPAVDTAPVSAFVDDHRQKYPDAGAALAKALLRAGQIEKSLTLLAELATREPEMALGQLVCALALGRDMALDLDLSQAAADAAFQHWIKILWASRQTELMVAFAENCRRVSSAFPWLPAFLAAETRRLQATD